MADYSEVGEGIWSPPLGWYRVGPVPGPGEVVAGAVGPVPLVAWAADDGVPVTAVARCAHLGADLSRGGVVDDWCLRCPFHGWRYGPDGAHAGTPAGAVVAGARLRLLPSRAAGDDLYAFHDPSGTTVPWEPAAVAWAAESVPESSVSEARVVDRAMGAPPVVVAEGAFDLAHFAEVHGVAPDTAEYGFDGPRAHISFTIGTGRRVFAFAFEFDGLTSLRETIRRDRYVLRRVFALTSAGDGWRSRVVSVAAGPQPKAVAAFADQLERAATDDLVADDALWRHRAFTQPSVYGPADRALREFRAWALPFIAPAAA